MTLICALPEEYSSFASSLQLMDRFEKEKLQEAFVAEEQLRNHSNSLYNSISTPTTSALAAATTNSPSVASALAMSSIPFSNLTCNFCSLPGHLITSCHHVKVAQLQATQAA